MFKYNNTHIFTGYLKQFLSSFNLPACRVYTHEFAKYLEEHGKEDPRVLESFDTTSSRASTRINYIKNNELYNYFWDTSDNKVWKKSSEVFYTSEKTVQGLTRKLNSPGIYYDTVTHEYLGEYLRFLRDYHHVNLMSMYNCFNDKIYNNIYFPFKIGADEIHQKDIIFNSQDSNYRIYAIPVKLFANYTIAIDCNQSVEMFCGLYNTMLDVSEKAAKLAAKTYMKVSKTLFNQPFLYNKLDIDNWNIENELSTPQARKTPAQINTDIFTRWDIAAREQDFKLFIKVPTSCRSSITILEGDYRNFNDAKYGQIAPVGCRIDTNKTTAWTYDTTLKTFKICVNGEDYVLGTDNKNPSYVKPIKASLLNLENTPFICVQLSPKDITKETEQYKLALTVDDTPYYINGNITSSNYLAISSDNGVNIQFDEISRENKTEYYLTWKTDNTKKYINVIEKLIYQNNRTILNFNTQRAGDGVDLNSYDFKPISKLQLLAFNTGESYPFADRLIEYLSGSAITPLEEIPDNIKRAQKVMEQNKNYFAIEGLWEDKMQNITYDYIMNAGDIVVDPESGKLVDKRTGYHKKLGHTCKSTLYDVLGYIDRDAEKLYASWKIEGNKAQIKDSIQNIDIYDGLFDIK